MAHNYIHGLLSLFKTGQTYLKNKCISETKGAIVLVFQKNYEVVITNILRVCSLYCTQTHIQIYTYI